MPNDRVLHVRITRDQHALATNLAREQGLGIEDWVAQLIHEALERASRWTEPGRADCSHSRRRPEGKIPGLFVCRDCGATIATSTKETT